MSLPAVPCGSRIAVSRQAELGLDLVPGHVVVFLTGHREFGTIKCVLGAAEQTFEDTRIDDDRDCPGLP